eukprot:TRINITY_DN963_c0_g1_i1.p1 TRINITY_DN963_c0_g1~~TRINITY_DN963_c0_g1_i1.p1  ORF type:complete len:323 (+),score=90.20 TRINITY_DN963_c0_g1_i1:33-1001(+)
MTIPVILDCDPGHDDALAIMMLANHPNIELLGVTTVAGNQSVEKTAINACRALCISGKLDVDVIVGASKPLVKPSRVCPEIHGESGLDGVDWTYIDSISSKPRTDIAAINFIHEKIINSKDAVTLIATGCLTNIALYLSVYPQDISRINELVVMGGAYSGKGNILPTAEFNVLLCPESYQIVLNSGIKFKMVPLEVTHTALCTEEIIQQLDTVSYVGNTVYKLLTFFKDTYLRVFGFDNPPVHDPCAVFAVLEPEMFVWRHLYMQVECQSEMTLGTTVCDVFNTFQKEPNTYVATEMNVVAFWNEMLKSIDRAKENFEKLKK